MRLAAHGPRLSASTIHRGAGRQGPATTTRPRRACARAAAANPAAPASSRCVQGVLCAAVPHVPCAAARHAQAVATTRAGLELLRTATRVPRVDSRCPGRRTVDRETPVPRARLRARRSIRHRAFRRPAGPVRLLHGCVRHRDAHGAGDDHGLHHEDRRPASGHCRSRIPERVRIHSPVGQRR